MPSIYVRLREQVSTALLQGQERIEREKVRTYWETGRLINEYLLKNTPSGKERAAYNKKIIVKLSQDLDIDESMLYKCVRFSQCYKKVDARPLSWAHYRALLSIPDEKKRERLAERVNQEAWTSRELEQEIKKGKIARQLEETKKPPELLKPVRGSLYTYRLRLDPIIQSAEPALRVDLGFSCYQEINVRGFKVGDIVVSERGLSLTPKAAGTDPNGSYSLKKSTQTTADLFTFKAYVERIIDGDTLVVQVDLGFSLWTRQYLRLRGIDCPEIDTPEGKKAKKFVEKELEGVPYVIISSSKSDKYDRYLADIFYASGERGLSQAKRGTAPNGTADLKFLNNELLTKRLAVRW